MAIADEAFSMVQFCGYIPLVVRSTIGLHSDSYASCILLVCDLACRAVYSLVYVYYFSLAFFLFFECLPELNAIEGLMLA